MAKRNRSALNSAVARGISINIFGWGHANRITEVHHAIVITLDMGR